MPNLENDRIDLDPIWLQITSVYCCSPVFGGLNFEYFMYCLVLNCEIPKKVFIYVYHQFRSEFIQRKKIVYDITENPLKSIPVLPLRYQGIIAFKKVYPVSG